MNGWPGYRGGDGGGHLAVHHAIAVAFPGAVLAIDAGGYMKNAVWGGITHRAAELRTLGGIVIDGCIRDAAEIRASALPCYAAGVVPAGPHKGWGGTINGPIQIGGCPVQPGDILVGDDDGIAVVPFDERGELLQRCVARMAFEESVLHRLDGGESTVEILISAPDNREPARSAARAATVFGARVVATWRTASCDCLVLPNEVEIAVKSRQASGRKRGSDEDEVPQSLVDAATDIIRDRIN